MCKVTERCKIRKKGTQRVISEPKHHSGKMFWAKNGSNSANFKQKLAILPIYLNR